MNWKTMKILSDFITVALVVIVMCAMMAGCASVPTVDECQASRFPTEGQLTECIKDAEAELDRQYELEDRWAREQDIWQLCERVHASRNNITYHKHDHNRMRPETELGRREKIRQDIQSNNCMFIWKQYERMNR